MAFQLSSLLSGGLGQLFKDVVGTFKLSPEKKAELDTILESHSHELAIKEVELEGKIADSVSREIEAASANIRAEATNGDKYTARARPTFMYIINFILAWNYVVAPLIKRPVLELPDMLFWLFGSAVLGYTGARAWEKVMALPGESSVSLPFGTKSMNKR